MMSGMLPLRPRRSFSRSVSRSFLRLFARGHFSPPRFGRWRCPCRERTGPEVRRRFSGDARWRNGSRRQKPDHADPEGQSVEDAKGMASVSEPNNDDVIIVYAGSPPGFSRAGARGGWPTNAARRGPAVGFHGVRSSQHGPGATGNRRRAELLLAIQRGGGLSPSTAPGPHLIGLLPREAPLFVGFQEIGGGEDLATLAKRPRRDTATSYSPRGQRRSRSSAISTRTSGAA